MDVDCEQVHTVALNKTMNDHEEGEAVGNQKA